MGSWVTLEIVSTKLLHNEREGKAREDPINLLYFSQYRKFCRRDYCNHELLGRVMD